MKSILLVLIAFFLAMLQTVVLPINFALLLILVLVSTNKIQASLVVIIAGSFFLSIFTNINFGIILISLSFSLLIYLILRRYIPDRVIFRFTTFAFVLVIWEILFQFSNRVFESFL